MHQGQQSRSTVIQHIPTAAVLLIRKCPGLLLELGSGYLPNDTGHVINIAMTPLRFHRIS